MQQTRRRAAAPAAPAAARRRAAGGGGGGGGGRGGAAVPYWGKYVYHDNNRDINLSQVSMRAIADWYFTAHPPIMHDLHESQPLLYTYSGGPPQNPNLDPILFAELPFFSNFELAQMTKWGMPGVYTHAFMDGWSPGYLGSVAYNHNGMMRMYETQSGARAAPRAGARRGGAGGATRAGGRARRRGAAAAAPAAAARGAARGTAAGAARRAAGRPPAARCGAPAATPSAARRRARRPRRGRARRPGAAAASRASGIAACRFRRTPSTTSRGATTRTTCRPACCRALQLTSMFPNLVVENFYTKTQNSIEAGKTEAPYGYVIPVQRDMTRVGRARQHPARAAASRSARRPREIKIGDGTFPAGSYVIKRDQPYGRLAKNLLEKQDYPDPEPPHLRRQRLDDGPGDAAST